MLNKELTGACSTPIILSVISKQESYGYQIIQDIREQSNQKIEWSEGMLYPLLRRMEQQGLLKSRWHTPETGRKRRYYEITTKGRHALSKEQENWREANTMLESIWNLNPQNV